LASLQTCAMNCGGGSDLPCKEIQQGSMAWVYPSANCTVRMCARHYL